MSSRVALRRYLSAKGKKIFQKSLRLIGLKTWNRVHFELVNNQCLIKPVMAPQDKRKS